MVRSSARGYARGAYIALAGLRQFSLLFALCLPALAQPAPALAQPSKVVVRPGLAYGPLPEELGDLHLPGEPSGRARPAVLMIHGGGWTEGSRQANDGLADLVASMGLAVFNIDYRLADLAKPATRWPAQLVDAQLAVRFLRAHAAEFGIDPQRIGAMGDSSGAQLALFLGELPRIVPGDQAALYAAQRPDVAAVLDQYGPTDLAQIGPWAAHSFAAMFGNAAPPVAELQAASPLALVTSHTAPVYIVQGLADKIVPASQSTRLRDALRARGVGVTLVTYQGDHAYEGVSLDRIASLQSAAIRWLIEQLR